MKMAALTMIGPENEMEPVARQMVLTGGFQPLPLDILLSDRNLRSQVTTSTENPYDELLSKVTTIWKVAGSPIPDPLPTPIEKDFTMTKAKYIVDQLTNRLEIWEKRRNELIEEEELLTSAKLFVKALQGTKFSPIELSESIFVKTFFGRISDENFTRLIESSEESPIIINKLSEVKGNKWIMIMSPVTYEQETQKLLNAVYFKRFSLATISEEISGENPLEKITKRIANRQRAIKGLSKAAKDLLNEQRKEYELLYSQLYTMQRVYDLCKGRGEVSGMFLLSGWIPEDTLETIKKTIEEEAPNTTIMLEDTRNISYSGIKVPTILKNTALFRAFQDIVAMYSLPSYGEIDPSPAVAISFILFFGFMFGDVGHGLIIFLLASYLMKNGKIKRSLGQVMKSASVSSIVFGFLYGSIFGLEEVIPALWLSPMKDTNKLIVIAICLGVFMISLGLIMNMVQQYRNKDFGRLLFDGQGLAGLILYWTMAILAASYMSGFKMSELAANIMWGGIILMIVLMIFRDVLARYLLRQKNESESVVLNIFEIMHNLMSFVSNTASFVRLAAFALNHVGLSMAVIMLSDMVHSLPGGIVMKGLILILGNVIIVALEGLIVFIQTLRLEYYEFFGKFYKGGGKAFKPIAWNKNK
ncbi:MAG: V-type ATPase 116kDa subunit family protein [Synergistaceae bacterium]